MSDLFNTAKCDLPAIPKKDFQFVTGCEVRPAPPMINDCPRPEIAFTGVGATPDCVSIAANGTVEVEPNITPTVDIIVTREQVDVPGSAPRCKFTFDLNFALPGNAGAPCVAISMRPEITEQRSEVVPVIVAEVTTISMSSLGCKHEIELNIGLPDRRIYPGVIITPPTGCGTVVVQTQSPAPVWTVHASIWLRNCCNGKTLTAGKRVWIALTDFGWGIIGTEEVLVVPVVLTSAMTGGEATADFAYGGGTTLTVTDPMSLFKCTFNGARGHAMCNDPFGTGTWELISAEQYALWIQFRVGSDPFDNAGPIEVFLVEHHNGAEPPLTSLKLEVKNPLLFKSSQNRLGFAMRRDDCGYDVWQVQCSIGGGGS